MVQNKFQGECSKIFGSSKLPAGTYTIVGADLFEKEYTLNGKKEKYASLEVLFKDVEMTLPLNGCWRKRCDVGGKAHQATGSFFTKLLEEATGKTFPEVVVYINERLKDRKIQLDYEDYQTNYGFGSVPIANFIEKEDK